MYPRCVTPSAITCASQWNCSRGCAVPHARILLSSRADNARSLNDIESSLPAEIEAKEAAINDALYDRAAKFLSTHTVELTLPEEVSRSFDEGNLSKIDLTIVSRSLLFSIILRVSKKHIFCYVSPFNRVIVASS